MRTLALIFLLLTLALAGCGSEPITGQVPDGLEVDAGEYLVTVTADGAFTAAPWTPTPAPTVTVTATATTTPTASATPTPAPTTTYTTMRNARLESGKVYEHVIFTGGTSTTGVLHLNYNLSNVVLRDCIVETGPQNGISLNASDSVTVTNLTLEDVVVRPQPRMGIEFTDRSNSAAHWRDVTLTRVTVEPSGSEAMSFDQNSKTAVNLSIKDCLIKGSGTRPDLYAWGQGFELNAPKDVDVDGLTIWQTRGAAFNLTGPGTGVACGWTFRNVTADMRLTDPAQTQPMSSTAQVLYAKNMTGSVWRNCVVAAGGTGSWCGYLSACTGNDFTGVTWIDDRAAPKVGLYNGSTGNVGLP